MTVRFPLTQLALTDGGSTVIVGQGGAVVDVVVVDVGWIAFKYGNAGMIFGWTAAYAENVKTHFPAAGAIRVV